MPSLNCRVNLKSQNKDFSFDMKKEDTSLVSSFFCFYKVQNAISSAELWHDGES
jgi:hypothetical protein